MARFLVLCCCLLVVPSSAEDAWRDKVHPEVLKAVEQGPAEFLVLLDERADLSAGLELETKVERGRHVYETLRRHAAATQRALIAELAERGVEHRSFWIANMVLVRGDRALVEQVSSRPEVRRVAANPRVRVRLPQRRPDEARSAETAAVEWNVSRVGADAVWALGYDGSGVVVGNQDTGFEWHHPALIGAYRGWDGSVAVHDHNWHDSVHSGGGSCGFDSPQPCDDHNHGTHTLGTMLGDDGAGNRIGVSPGATWIGCRNMDQGVGTPATYTECFQWFLAPTDGNGDNADPALAPDVINNSWTCPPDEGCDVETLRTIVDSTRAAGIVVVTSAGNSGPACGTIQEPPAIYDAALSVGALDIADVATGFSSRGPVTVDGSGRLKPDITAPGENVRSSVRDGVYGLSSGTSMAGPHAAGVVALLLHARPDLRGRVDEIEEVLRRSAMPLVATAGCGNTPAGAHPNNTYGFGRVDALETITGDADSDGAGNLTDCRPVDAGTYPGAPDLCDSTDNDCDGTADESVCSEFDLNGDGRVGGVELAWLGLGFGSHSDDPSAEWWGAVDYTRDGKLDGADLAVLAAVWACAGGEAICP